MKISKNLGGWSFLHVVSLLLAYLVMAFFCFFFFVVYVLDCMVKAVQEVGRYLFIFWIVKFPFAIVLDDGWSGGCLKISRGGWPFVVGGIEWRCNRIFWWVQFWTVEGIFGEGGSLGYEYGYRVDASYEGQVWPRINIRIGALVD